MEIIGKEGMPTKMGEAQKLKGKVAIVTGGGKGLGRAIALGFAKEGADLLICGREMLPLEKVCEEARSFGISAFPLKADVSVEYAVEKIVEETLKVFRKIDILVNNAGVAGPVDLITDISKEVWDELLNINLTGMFLCSRAVLKHMIERGTGNIINLSSSAGFRGSLMRSLPYTVSKWGVEGFTYALAVQMKRYRICVNALRPGRTDTNLHKDTPLEIRAKMRKPHSVSKLAVFLSLQTVDTMTGESIELGEWEKEFPGH